MLNISIFCLMGICLIGSLVGSLIFIFTFYRINWVYDERIKILHIEPVKKSLEEYDKLPSYNYMIYHFWIWDIEKFKNPDK